MSSRGLRREQCQLGTWCLIFTWQCPSCPEGRCCSCFFSAAWSSPHCQTVSTLCEVFPCSRPTTVVNSCGIFSLLFARQGSKRLHISGELHHAMMCQNATLSVSLTLTQCIKAYVQNVFFIPCGSDFDLGCNIDSNSDSPGEWPKGKYLYVKFPTRKHKVL